MNWEHIDTAPKDGTPVLAFTGKIITIVCFDSCAGWELHDPGSYAEWIDRNPTHWMPLPAPPEE